MEFGAGRLRKRSRSRFGIDHGAEFETRGRTDDLDMPASDQPGADDAKPQNIIRTRTH